MCIDAVSEENIIEEHMSLSCRALSNRMSGLDRKINGCRRKYICMYSSQNVTEENSRQLVIYFYRYSASFC